jgi:hypothetical protein
MQVPELQGSSMMQVPKIGGSVITGEFKRGIPQKILRNCRLGGQSEKGGRGRSHQLPACAASVHTATHAVAHVCNNRQC